MEANNVLDTSDGDGTSTHPYSYGMFRNYMEVYIKEMDKVLKGHPKHWITVKRELDSTLAQQTMRINDLLKKTKSSSETTQHKLVSSNGPIECSPNGKRYKPFHEY